MKNITVDMGEVEPVPLLDLIDSWAAHASLLAREAASPVDPLADNRTVFDYIGALHQRSRLDRALQTVPQDVALPCVAAADELFRWFTAVDETQKLHRGWGEVPVEPWWWQRIPTAGPVFEELKCSW